MPSVAHKIPARIRKMIQQRTARYIREAIIARGNDIEAMKSVARDIRYTVNSVRNYRSGDTFPTFSKCEWICKALKREYPA